MVLRSFFTAVVLFFTGIISKAQNYQALHGSSYAGSLGAAVNPASIVHDPFAWDLTVFAIQAKYGTNAVHVSNFSLLSNSSAATIKQATGKMERFFMANQDIRILNGRFRINERSAFAAGASVRSYQSVKTSAYDWNDSIGNIRDFMAANLSNTPLTAELRGAAWAELFGCYARNIIYNDNALLNAGVTLKVNRGLGGAYLSAAGLYYVPGQVHSQNGYLLNNGQLEFAYSSNFDEWDSAGSNTEKRKKFLKRTWSSISLNLGAEYIIPSGAEDNIYSYDLRIGVSLLDLGYNKYQYSSNSRYAVMNKGNISDSLIEATFENLGATDEVPDSVGAIAGSSSSLPGYFNIFQPARLVINADKRIAGNFFLNAELTLQLAPLLGSRKLFTRDMSLAALTPRFETRMLGIYLPATLNTNMQVWLGGALRAGPLLLGIHNWATLFSKNKVHNGGAYLALTFRPWNNNNPEEEGGSGGTKGQKRAGRKKDRMGCPANVL